MATIAINKNSAAKRKVEEEVPHHPAVRELKDKLDQAERRNQLITMLSEKNSRIEHMEKIVDDKLTVHNVKRNEELQKRIDELSSKITEYERTSQSLQQFQQKAYQAEQKAEELKKRIEYLAAKLDDFEQKLSMQHLLAGDSISVDVQPEELHPTADAESENEVETSHEMTQSDGTEDQKQEVINNGVLTMIVKAMETGNSDCQKECSWALFNILEYGLTTQIHSLMDEKPIPVLVAALAQADDYCFANILGVIQKLLYTANPNQLEMLKKDANEKGFLDHLKKRLQNTKEECTLVRDSDILPLVFNHLNVDGYDLVYEALGVLVIMTACTEDSLAQSVIDVGTLSVLPELVEKHKYRPHIVRNSCRLIGNLIAGTDNERQEVINNGLLAMIVKVMQTGESDVCSWALANLIKIGTTTQIELLLAEKPMPALASPLSHANPVYVANRNGGVGEIALAPYLQNTLSLDKRLEVIHKLFSTVDENQLESLKKEAKEAGVIGHLKKLQNRADDKVQHLAKKISEYFAENNKEDANDCMMEREEDKTKNKAQKRMRTTIKEENEEEGEGKEKGVKTRAQMHREMTTKKSVKRMRSSIADEEKTNVKAEDDDSIVTMGVLRNLAHLAPFAAAVLYLSALVTSEMYEDRRVFCTLTITASLFSSFGIFVQLANSEWYARGPSVAQKSIVVSMVASYAIIIVMFALLTIMSGPEYTVINTKKSSMVSIARSEFFGDEKPLMTEEDLENPMFTL